MRYLHRLLLFILIFYVLGPNPNKAQTPIISDVIYLEKNDGLKQRVIKKVIRGANGYFYLFGDNHIQRFDGKVFKDVDIKVLIDNKVALRELADVRRIENDVVLTFLNQSNIFRIPASSLYLEPIEKELNEKNNEKKIIRSGDKEFVVITTNNKYLWESNEVYKLIDGAKELVAKLPHEDIAPKIFRKDRQDNIIAVYSNEQQFIERIYVLDTQEQLHDLSHVVEIYSTALDIYADDAFYKWMIAGYNGVKVITFQRDGIEHIDKRPGVDRGGFGRIISGIAQGEEEVIYCSESRYVSSYSESGTAKWIDSKKFASDGFGQCKYDTLTNSFFIRGYEGVHSSLYEVKSGSDKIIQHQFLNDIRDFVFDVDGDMIFVSNSPFGEGKVISYNRDTRNSNVLVKGLPPLSSIYYSTSHQQYWVGSKKGLFVFDNDFKKLASFSMQMEGHRLMIHDEIVTIAEFSDHIIVCSDGGGIYLIDPVKLTLVRSISENEGLTNSTAVSVLVDDENNCWIGTYNGLNVLNDNFELIEKVYDQDGLSSREFNRMAAAKLDGNLYFGTLNGMCVIDPKKVLSWDESYQLSIDKVLSFKGNEEKIINIKSEQNVYDSEEAITIDYTLTDYSKIAYDEGKIDFSVNQKEIEIDQSEGRLRLSNISAGPLEMSIAPKLSSDKQNFQINVERDYSNFLKWFFIFATMILISLLLAYGIIQHNKKKEAQKTSTNKKISELQLSALQGQMNPHFIFNALGAIQYFIQTNDTQKADEYLSDFALLMRGILDSSSKKFISLKEELNLLKLYTNLEKARFENKFEVNFKVDDDVDEEILIPPMIIQPYIENAVNHGLHHLKGKVGKLDILIQNVKDHLSIVVRDNGVGRKAANEIQVGKQHKSKGMSITRDRIETLNSSSGIDITFSIEDLYEFENPAGTEVVLTFKDV